MAKKGERFNQKQKEHIVKRAIKSVPYNKIAKELNHNIQKNHYNSKQVREQYVNDLMSGLCKDPLDENEKEFIVQHVQEHNGVFSTREIIPAIKDKFDKLRSERQIKNFWYPHLRRQTPSANPRRRRTLPPLSSRRHTLPPRCHQTSPHFPVTFPPPRRHTLPLCHQPLPLFSQRLLNLPPLYRPILPPPHPNVPPTLPPCSEILSQPLPPGNPSLNSF